MTIYETRRRVACYVTRRAATGGLELLVFEHVDEDPANPSGLQVPAGGRLPFSSLSSDAFREVQEETGVDEVTFVRSLGAVELGPDQPGGPALTDYVHLEATGQTADTWEHSVTGGGDDEGLVFACRWESLPLNAELAAGQDVFLGELSS
jgi:8-oxo-dGTP pyrophosphatase MutT (NUDIX family)